MTTISSGPTGSFRVNTRTAQPRSSSNKTFQEQFRSGLGNGLDVANSAFKMLTKPIPGAASLSATLSNAARGLAGPSGLGEPLSNSLIDPDGNSLQGEVLKNNQDLLEQQLRVSQITTSFSTRSNILKALFDTLKTIGSNIR